MVSRFIAPLLVAGLVAACTTTPTAPPHDLSVNAVSVSPAVAGPGDEFAVSTAALNIGAGAVFAPRPDEPAGYVSIALFRQSDGREAAGLARTPLPVGDFQPNSLFPVSQMFSTPPSLAPGDYTLCATADAADDKVDANTGNNRACTNLKVLGAPAPKADLVIDSIRRIGAAEASFEIIVDIRNAGSAAAAPFRLMGFRQSPRRPIVVATCATTFEQWEISLPPACGPVETSTALAPGETISLKAFVSTTRSTPFDVNTPNRDDDRIVRTRRTVNIMVDGCYPPTDGASLPHWCRVREVNELNNFREVTIRTPD